MSIAEMDGRVVLVTGGTGSVGEAVCRTILGAGARLVVHGATQHRVDRLVDSLRLHYGDEKIAGKCRDLVTAEGPIELVKEAAAAFGRLDGIINCMVSAPDAITGPFRDTDPAQFTILLDHSVSQAQRLLHAALPVMDEGGSFITMISDAALFTAPNQSLIAASRAAIAAFCRNAALEVARQGVRVNCVSTSYVAGSRIVAAIEASGGDRPARAAARAGLGLPTADDIANLCLFLMGPGATRLTGQVISVNGGLNT